MSQQTTSKVIMLDVFEFSAISFTYFKYFQLSTCSGFYICTLKYLLDNFKAEVHMTIIKLIINMFESIIIKGRQ